MKTTNSVLALAAVAIAIGTLVAQQPAAPGGGKGGPKTDAKGKVNIGLYRRQTPPPTGPAPKFADGRPDFTGVWVGGGSSDADISRALKPGDSVVPLKWAADLVKTRQSKDDPEANCLPAGVPRGSPYPWRIVQTPTHVFLLYEGNIHSYRQVFIDGRKHPAGDDLDPTWYGHSIGHYEGQTLVIDTVGYNGKFWFDYVGHPNTEQLHTIERYTRTDMGNLSIEVTIEDPGAYEKPFTTTGRARLMVDAELMEYICQEDNFDLEHISGPAQGPGPAKR